MKVPNDTKGIHLEGLRTIGNLAILARDYYEQGADEILYINIMGSLSERNNLLGVIEQTTSLGVFIPIIVGGGIRTLEHVRQAFRSGADKVAISTAAIQDPDFITKAAQMYGSQCIVGSIEVKKTGDQRWEVCIDNGRQKTGLDAIEWAKKLVELGAGELLVTSVDAEGVQKGYDKEVLKRIIQKIPVPVIVSGGAGSIQDIENCINEVHCEAISMASLLHYSKSTIVNIKNHLMQHGIPTRIPPPLSLYQVRPSIDRKKVSIIDYGSGNLKSVISAFEHVGNEVQVINTPEDLLKSELLVLPGMGAFSDGINGLKQRGLVAAILDYKKTGKPLLGICLGMQLLMSETAESGFHKGLDLIQGSVIKFKDQNMAQEPDYHVPHMGWNSIYSLRPGAWENTILKDISQDNLFYFIHSYCVMPEHPENILAETLFGKQRLCSVIQSGNIYGTQFHPEKSGEMGLRILDAFGKL